MTTAVDALSARAASLALRVSQAPRRARALIACLAGALSVLAMAPFFATPVLFVTLPLLVWLIDGAGDGGVGGASAFAPATRASLMRAALTGWFFGFAYFLFGMFWVAEAFLVEAEKFAWLLPLAVTLLPAGLALFFALAAALARLLWRPGFARVLVVATTIGLAEGLRGHVFTGLPWNTLGYALTWPLTLMQSAGLVGIYALTVLAVVIFASPLVVLAGAPTPASATAPATGRPRAFRQLAGVAVAFALLGGLWSYGVVRLAGDPGHRVEAVKLRIVQPAIRQRDKWRPEKQREIFDLHVELSRHNADGVRDDLAGITHLIWPEAAMPFLPLDSPIALQEIGDLLPDGVHLVTGALRVEWSDRSSRGAVIPRSDNETAPGSAAGINMDQSPAPKRNAFNSLMVFGPQGGLVALYDKIHLVPFGEYLPFQMMLERIGLEQLTRIRGGFEVGRTPRPLLDVPGLPPFVGLVCYEAIFPGEIVQGPDRPGLIVNVTNDGWFGNTTGPRQHFHMARVRAIEEGVPFIRVANNGISAVFDAYGRTIARLDLDRRAVMDSVLPAATSAPIYAWWGELIYIIYILTSLAWLAGTSFITRFVD